jgi:hypothetical protein
MAVKIEVEYNEDLTGSVKLNGEPISVQAVNIDLRAKELPIVTITTLALPFIVQLNNANLITVIGDKTYRLIEEK